MRAEGAWTRANASVVLGQVPAYIKAGTVDLSGVTAIDSTTLALLLETRRRASRAGRTVRFVNATAPLAALAAFFGIDDILAA